MNKQDLINKMAEEAKIKKSEAAKAFEVMFKDIEAGLVKEKKVLIPGFGIFTLKNREARTARNPRTGESIQIDAKKTVTFKPASALKDRLN